MIPQSTEFCDTDPRTMEMWLEVLRGKTPGERMMIAFELSDFAARVSESGVRGRYPKASERKYFSARPHSDYRVI